MITIRRGSDNDIPEIRTFLRDSWGNHATNEPEYFNREFMENDHLDGDYLTKHFADPENSRILIAEQGAETVGLCTTNIAEIQRFFAQTRVLYIDDIYVKPEFRREGVAQLLLNEAALIAQGLGISWLKARVYEFNTSAQQLFSNAGYKPLYSEYFKIS